MLRWARVLSSRHTSSHADRDLPGSQSDGPTLSASTQSLLLLARLRNWRPSQPPYAVTSIVRCHYILVLDSATII